MAPFFLRVYTWDLGRRACNPQGGLTEGRDQMAAPTGKVNQYKSKPNPPRGLRRADNPV